MEAVILIGIQGSGKSTFFQQRFASTHVRINLDTLKTRHQESLLLNACIAGRKDFVVDNTSPAVEQRKRYISAARAAGYRITGYFFDVPISECIERNKSREGKAKIAIPALYGTRKKMQPPSFEEGFDALFGLSLTENGFDVRPWAETIHFKTCTSPQP
jgi:predicted kinase